jgi:hypothetical protein
VSYRFDGVDDQVSFSAAPLNGYANGAITIACFLKRNVLSTFDDVVGVFDSGGGIRVAVYVNTSNQMVVYRSVNGTSSASISSTSIWYLIAVTFNSGGGSRYHIHDGTSWTHAGAASHSSVAIGATDKIIVSSALTADFMAADVVCAGIKKSDSSDATIETLSRTDFSAWQAFGFDWLAGFDTSLQAAGVLQDQATPGTGDETAKTGTTVVSDPPGWTWAAAPAAPKSGFLGFM